MGAGGGRGSGPSGASVVPHHGLCWGWWPEPSPQRPELQVDVPSLAVWLPLGATVGRESGAPGMSGSTWSLPPTAQGPQQPGLVPSLPCPEPPVPAFVTQLLCPHRLLCPHLYRPSLSLWRPHLHLLLPAVIPPGTVFWSLRIRAALRPLDTRARLPGQAVSSPPAFESVNHDSGGEEKLARN